MNLNQAKSVVGIPASESIAGRASIEMAIKQCVKAIIIARKAGDDQRAAHLSEAKEVFRKRLSRNCCAVCGVTIGGMATHCQTHQRRKALPPPVTALGPIEKPKGNGNARLDVSPAGGLIARFGFYARPVQDVFAKWEKILGAEIVTDCLCSVAIDLHDRKVSLNLVPRPRWQCKLELAAALTSVLHDRKSPQGWLLNNIHVLQVADAENGFASWKEISARTGGRFSASRLSKAAERLQLLTSPSVAAAFRRAVKTK